MGNVEKLTQEQKDNLGLNKYDPTKEQSSSVEQNKESAKEVYADTDSFKPSEITVKAALDLLKESNATIAALNTEIANLKQANAKLAIQQSISAPTKSAEDIINEMFK